MYVVMWVVIVLLIAVLLALLSKCKLYIEWSAAEGTVIKIGIMGLWFKHTKTSSEADKTNKKEKTSLKEIESSISNILENTAEIKNKIVVENAELYIEIGLGDAAATGIATGAAWAVVYNLLAILDNLFILKKRKTDIVPNFLEEKLDACFSITFSVRIYHLLLILKKFSK